MNQANATDHLVDLVLLQVADHVKAHAGRLGHALQRLELAPELLRAVLAKEAPTGADGEKGGVGVHGLGDRDDLDLARVAPDPPRGVGDPPEDRRAPLTQKRLV